MLDHVRAQFDWANDALYGSQHTRTDKAVAAGRLAMLLLGLILGAFTAAWAGWLGARLAARCGAAAAVIAAALFAFDPNMLAHSSLVTNDIAFSLVFALVAWATWLAGRKLSLVRAGVLALACAIAINVKFSALVCGPIVALLLLVRALLPAAWPAMGRLVLRRRISRVAAAIGLGLACLAVCIPVTWATYGFRFAVGQGGEQFNTSEMMRAIRWRDHKIPHRQEPITE